MLMCSDSKIGKGKRGNMVHWLDSLLDWICTPIKLTGGSWLTQMLLCLVRQLTRLLGYVFLWQKLFSGQEIKPWHSGVLCHIKSQFSSISLSKVCSCAWWCSTSHLPHICCIANFVPIQGSVKIWHPSLHCCICIFTLAFYLCRSAAGCYLEQLLQGCVQRSASKDDDVFCSKFPPSS